MEDSLVKVDIILCIISYLYFGNDCKALHNFDIGNDGNTSECKGLTDSYYSCVAKTSKMHTQCFLTELYPLLHNTQSLMPPEITLKPADGGNMAKKKKQGGIVTFQSFLEFQKYV